MGKNSSVDWTDHSWNPWQGCRKVSPGCLNCYMYRDKTRYGQDPATVIRSQPKTFNSPLRWKNEPAKVFVCSWSDFFIEDADPWRDDAWEIIRKCPHLTFQLLTKRSKNIKDRLPDDWPLPNVWLGVTAENQEQADRRIPVLLQIPAAVRFVSIEPMLGPVDIYYALPSVMGGMCLRCGYIPIEGMEEYLLIHGDTASCVRCDGKLPPVALDWVICGGETGPGSRLMNEYWALALKMQCELAGVPFFMKQMTNKAPIPEYLQCREFPK